MTNGDTSEIRPRAPIQVSTVVNELLKLSPSIRVVTICNMNGKVVYSAHSKRVKNVLSASQSRASLRNAAIAWKRRKSLSRKLGSCKYVVAEYSRIKRITMPAGRNHILFVTTTSAFDHNKLIRRVRHFR